MGNPPPSPGPEVPRLFKKERDLPKSSRCEVMGHHSLFQVNSFQLSCRRGVTHVESMPQSSLYLRWKWEPWQGPWLVGNKRCGRHDGRPQVLMSLLFCRKTSSNPSASQSLTFPT